MFLFIMLITIGYCIGFEDRTPRSTRRLLFYLDLFRTSGQLSSKRRKICRTATYREYIPYSRLARIKFDVHRNHQAIGIRFSSRKTQVGPSTTLKNAIWPNIWIPSRVSCGLPLLRSNYDLKIVSYDTFDSC